VTRLHIDQKMSQQAGCTPPRPENRPGDAGEPGTPLTGNIMIHALPGMGADHRMYPAPWTRIPEFVGAPMGSGLTY